MSENIQPNMESSWQEKSRTEVSPDKMIFTDEKRFEGPEWEVVTEGLAQKIGDISEKPHNMHVRYRVRKFKGQEMYAQQEAPYDQHDLTDEAKKVN
jgi:hypothetical protein